jgi:hypothetical protein
MVRREAYRAGLAWAGLWIGPAVWVISFQARYSLVPWTCAGPLPLIHVVTVAAALIVGGSGYLSWLAWASSSEGAADSSGAGQPHRFVALIGVAAAALFTFLILLQGSAAFVLAGCAQ